MMTGLFADKNVLILYPADNSGFPAKLDALIKHFKSARLLNFVAYSHTHGIKNTERRIKDLIAGEKIDILLSYPFATDYQLSVDFYNSLRKEVKLVFCFMDDATYFEVYDKYYAQVADAVTTVDYSAIFAYKRLGIPAVLCQEVFVEGNLAPIAVKKDIDVSFIGDVRKRGRLEYIKFLKEAGINIVVYGQGSDNGFLPFDKMSEYICRSKISLNFSQNAELTWINSDEPLLNRVRIDTYRPREVALTGSFCLCEYSPFLHEMFNIGKEIDTFRDKAELLEKVAFYLSNPQKREALAVAAHKRAMEQYQPDIAARRLLKDLLSVLAGPDPSAGLRSDIYLSDSFKIKEVNGLTFSMFIMLKNGKWRFAFEAFRLLFKNGFRIFLAGFYGGTIRALRSMSGKLAKLRVA
jgi:hypothetical protein